jgi:hypothetical protein
MRPALSIAGNFDGRLSARGYAAALGGILLTFLTIVALAHVAHAFALIALIVLLGASCFALPRLGIATLVMLIPVQGLAAVGRADMPYVIATLLIAVNVRHPNMLRASPLRALPPVLLVFAAFLVLYALRMLFGAPAMSAEQLAASIREFTYLLLVCGAALSTLHYCRAPNGDDLRAGLLVALAYGLSLTLAVDTAAVYFPRLSDTLGLVEAWPGLRLAGLHINPNATAKFCVAGIALVSAALSVALGNGAQRKYAPYGVGALALMAAALAATQSKATLVGLLVAYAVAISILSWHRRFATAALLMSIACAVVLVGAAYEATLASGMAERIEANALGLDVPPQPAAQPREKPGVAAILARQLRVSESYEMKVKAAPPRIPDKAAHANSAMYRNIDGKIEYLRRDCGWKCAGQRDRLWRVAWETVARHWLLGIGPNGWPEQYLAELRFPFDSPHNGVLELWGGFGLPGLAVYFALIGAVLWMLPAAFTAPQAPFARFYGVTTLLFATALLLAEAFDPVKYLTLNPHAVWLWILLAGLPASISGGTIGNNPAPAQGHDNPDGKSDVGEQEPVRGSRAGQA